MLQWWRRTIGVEAEARRRKKGCEKSKERLLTCTSSNAYYHQKKVWYFLDNFLQVAARMAVDLYSRVKTTLREQGHQHGGPFFSSSSDVLLSAYQDLL